MSNEEGKNTQGLEFGTDGLPRHIPRDCISCGKARGVVYGRAGSWFCVGCWGESGIWKTREEIGI